VLALGALAQAAHHLQAVDARQHEVEHDEVGPPLAGHLERPLAVAGDEGGVSAALEVARDDVRDRALVVDDEHRGPDMAVRGQDPGFNAPRERRATPRGPSSSAVHRNREQSMNGGPEPW
jgi:hypothetical protein